MGIFSNKPWWKDKKNGWPGKGVRHFFDESKRYLEAGDLKSAIEVLEWGKRFSREFGSGGAISSFDSLIEKLRSTC